MATTMNVPGKKKEEWTKDDILRVLDNPKGSTGRHKNAQIIQRMLWRMYERQTDMERSAQATLVDNGVGFNGVDAALLSDVAQWSQAHGGLTEKQAALVAKKLRKYIRQLCDIAGVPFKVPGEKRRPEQKNLPFA